MMIYQNSKHFKVLLFFLHCFLVERNIIDLYILK